MRISPSLLTLGVTARLSTICLISALSACVSETSDEAGDPEGGAFSGPKADGFCAEEGSPEAAGVLALVNDLSVTLDALDRSTRDGGAGLNRIAAENIVQDRPFATMMELDAVPYVGVSACNALLAYACEEQGRCGVQACDPEVFPDRPQRTRYDQGCESLLLQLAQTEFRGSGEVFLEDASARCEALNPDQRTAFEAAVAAYGSTPSELSADYGEFSVEVFEAQGETLAVAHVIEQDNYTPFHVIFDASGIAAIWTTDGLSSGVDWYCGREGADDADAPDEFCLGALTDVRESCAAGDAQEARESWSVGEARTDFLSLEAAAVTVYADDNGLADEASVATVSQRCGTSLATVSVDGDGGPEAYRVVDSTRGLGRTVLSRTVDGQTEFVCRYPNG